MIPNISIQYRRTKVIDRQSRYKRFQLHKRDLKGVSGPIQIKLKKLVSRQIVYF